MTEKKEKVTILGVGNILLRDEGFGVHFVRWMAGRYRIPEGVRLVDGGTLGYALLDIICGCERLIVIDVIKLKDEPGSIYRFTREEMELRMPPPTSAHEVSFPDVLFKAELMEEAPETIFLCIVPQDYSDMDLELTPLLRGRFDRMEDLLLKELAAAGFRLERA
jgi:hydrogenase maturation protease